jgi:DeoR family transcriptional regulator of aga operon
MLRRARRKIVVADHRKLGATGSALICPLEGIDILITDKGATEESVAPFVARGIEVRRA